MVLAKALYGSRDVAKSQRDRSWRIALNLAMKGC
jgi:hypothetical protein